MSADPWGSEPIPFYATWDEAVRHDVFLLTEPTVEAAGGFDAVREDLAHPLHSVYDDIDALERNVEEIVARAHRALGEKHYIVNPHQGVRLTGEGFEIVGAQVDSVLNAKPALHYSDDPTFIRDHPDELGTLPSVIDPIPYRQTQAQALRSAILDELAPDIADAGGFPGVARNPNHRRHNSPKGLSQVRRQYDEIVERVEPWLTQQDFRQSDVYGWALAAQTGDDVKKTVEQVRREFAVIASEIGEAGTEKAMIAWYSYPGYRGEIKVKDIAHLAKVIAVHDGDLSTASGTSHGPAAYIPRTGRMDNITLSLFEAEEFEQAGRENLVNTMDWLVAHRYKDLAADQDQSREDSQTSDIAGLHLPDQTASNEATEHLVNDVVDRLITGGAWTWADQQANRVAVKETITEEGREPKSAAAQAISDVQEVRRHLKELKLGMRPDEYVQVLAGSAANGTSLQQVARDELARRESLSDEQQGIESRVRVEQQQRAARVRDRRRNTTELGR